MVYHDVDDDDVYILVSVSILLDACCGTTWVGNEWSRVLVLGLNFTDPNAGRKSYVGFGK
jgi:hypothetical protein